MTVKPNLRNNMKNPVKNATRHLVMKAYDTFVKNKPNVSVISLPGAVWEFETYVLSHLDFADNFGASYVLDMTLCEWNKHVYNHNKRPISNLFDYNKTSDYVLSRIGSDNYHNETLNEKIVSNAKSNNVFAWFDFCGNPSKENIDLINTAIGKNVCLVFTFNTHWRCNSNVDPEVGRIAANTYKSYAIWSVFKSLSYVHKLKMIWSFEYISNHNPMITLCLSNDENIINDASLTNNLPQMVIDKTNKNNKNKRDLSAVYVDVKNKIDANTICTNHNISNRTLAAVKAWVTMGK